MRTIMIGLSATAVATAAAAAPMTFGESLRLAATSAPSVKAAGERAEGARVAARTAKQLPDPTVEAGVQDFPVTGPDAGRFNRDDFTMTRVGISQPLPNLAKRNARAGRAASDIAAADAEARLEIRNVRAAAGMAWVDLHFAERRHQVIDKLADRVTDLVKTAPARLVLSRTTPSVALEPKQLEVLVADRRSALVAGAARARAELARWTGDPAPQATGPLPPHIADAAALKVDIDALPELKVREAAARQADADVRLARAEKRPDFGVNVSYGRREPNFGDLASASVSLTLPLFAGNRQDPLIAARRRDAEAARLDREATARELRAALDADLAEHAMHHDRFVRARDTLVPVALQRADLDRASYSAGALDLGSVLLSAFKAAEAELDAFDREAEFVRDGVRINLTYGEQSQ